MRAKATANGTGKKAAAPPPAPDYTMPLEEFARRFLEPRLARIHQGIDRLTTELKAAMTADRAAMVRSLDRDRAEFMALIDALVDSKFKRKKTTKAKGSV